MVVFFVQFEVESLEINLEILESHFSFFILGTNWGMKGSVILLSLNLDLSCAVSIVGNIYLFSEL